MALLYGLLMYKMPQNHAGCLQLTERLEAEFGREGYHAVLFDTKDTEAIPSAIFQCDNCRRHFLRGVFLSCGTVSAPASLYHLELAMPDRESADTLASFLGDLDMPPKQMKRRETEILYYKESERIIDFLTLIGAQNAAFEMINETIQKDLRNNANRHVNCDTANIHKTVNAAQKQIEAIRYLRDSGLFNELPEELKATAVLRETYPDMTLAELALVHEPAVTKSGVNHRLKKLEWLAKH